MTDTEKNIKIAENLFECKYKNNIWYYKKFKINRIPDFLRDAKWMLNIISKMKEKGFLCSIKQHHNFVSCIFYDKEYYYDSGETFQEAVCNTVLKYIDGINEQ